MNPTEMNVIEQQEVAKPVYSTKEAVIERLKQIVQDVESVNTPELNNLKQAYYKLQKAEQQKALKEYQEQGGDPKLYTEPKDELEVTFKAELNLIKERRATLFQQQEKERAENLEKKLAIIERFKVLAENTEEANQAYNEVKKLQAEWKAIGAVPPEKAAEVWKAYQIFVEKYYDILKINNEFREYDFRKNLETKTALCDEAEKLAQDEDVIGAFHKLQTLHQEFRDCGPVAKEVREEIWKRFKNASAEVNRRHQQHFEGIKAAETQNLEQKEAICKAIESIDIENITVASAWNEMTQKIIGLQADWKKIGYAPQKVNVKIFERFRAACDRFFAAKSAYFQGVKDNLSQNAQLKVALCEKAEQMKNSTDWKNTTDAYIRLQKEWKAIGPVAKKESDALWKRFTSACDYFFEQKEKLTTSLHNEEKANLKKKKEIIAKLKALVEEKADDIMQECRELTREWKEIGHVPFRDKDTVYEEYKTWLNNIYQIEHVRTSKKRLSNFKNGLREKVQEGDKTLTRERERLIRTYEVMKQELQTYENNIGFLNLTSKSSNGLVAEINHKVEKLKRDLEEQKAKILALEKEIRKQLETPEEK